MNLSNDSVMIAVTFAAILSPVLVAIFNIFYNLYCKKIDYKHSQEQQKQEYIQSIYENYFRGASNVTTYADEDAIKQYAASYAIAFIYFPVEYHQMLKNINENIRNRNFDVANYKLEELSIAMSELLR